MHPLENIGKASLFLPPSPVTGTRPETAVRPFYTYPEHTPSWEETYPQELHLFFNNFLPAWLKYRDYFHIKVHKHIPAVSAAMFDNKKGNLEVYMHGCLAGNRFVIELDFAGMAKDCKENLDKLWREATDLTSPEEFRKRIDTAAEAVKELNPRSEKV